MARPSAASSAGGGILIVINQSGPVTVPKCYNPKTITKHSLSLSLIPSSSSVSYPLLSRSRVLWVDYNNRGQGLIIRAAENMTTTTEKLGVKIQRNPPESKLTELGVRNWPNPGIERDDSGSLVDANVLGLVSMMLELVG